MQHWTGKDTKRALFGALAAGALAQGALASNYFVNHFDADPSLTNGSATYTNWSPDRYAPLKFQKTYFDGDNRLELALDPSGPVNSFYSWQGRTLLLENPEATIVRAKMYIPADAATKQRVSSIWVTADDGKNNNPGTEIDISAYPIFSFSSSGLVPRFRVWDDWNGGWIDLSVPATPGTWHTVQMRLANSMIEFSIDGSIVYTKTVSTGYVGNSPNYFGPALRFRDVMLESYLFSQTDPYSVYFDDLETASEPQPLNGLPVDLNGGYTSASSGSSTSGAAVAATFPLDGSDQVIERSQDVASTDEGTYTPFSDAYKKPTPLTLSAGDISSGFDFEADLNVGGTWATNTETFGLGVGSTFFRGARVYWDGTGYKVSLSTDDMNTNTITDGGTAFAVPADVNKVRVRVHVDGSGNLSGSVVKLNGATLDYSPVSLGSMTVGSALAGGEGFVAGYTAAGVPNAAGNIQVSNFTTSAYVNAVYAYCDMPYLTPSYVYNAVTYPSSYGMRIGMANLTQPVYGFQAFGGLTSTSYQILDPLKDSSNNTVVGAYYTGLPFDQHILNPLTQGLASGTYPTPTSGNATLAVLPYDNSNGSYVPSGQGSSYLVINPDNGNSSIKTRFTSGSGDVIPSIRQTSNVVLLDNTAPAVSVVSATQGAGNLLGSGTIVPGPMTITVSADDAGDYHTGLLGRPTITITWADNSTTTLTTTSGSGNTFQAVYNVPVNVPCGTVKFDAQASDRALNVGHASQQTGTLNKAQITVTLQLAGTSANANRWIHFVIGGGGGGNTAVSIDKVVTFSSGSATVTLNGLDGVPDCSHTVTQLWAKDPVHTLGTKVTLAKDSNAQYTGPTVVLRGGNANEDSVVDILDFGVFAYQWGSSQLLNSVINQPSGNADFSVNGSVGIEDYTFFGSYFLQSDDALPGNYSGPSPTPKQRCTVKEMVGTGVPETVAQSMDADKDGWITTDEVARWLDAKRRIKSGSRG